MCRTVIKHIVYRIIYAGKPFPVTKTIILWWILKTIANTYSCYYICKTFVRNKKKMALLKNYR